MQRSYNSARPAERNRGSANTNLRRNPISIKTLPNIPNRTLPVKPHWLFFLQFHSQRTKSCNMKFTIMKKLFIALFVLGIALPSFAGLKVKDVVGTWSYEVVTDMETLTGTLKFEKNGKELTGQVITDDGQIIPLSNVQIKENNVLYFEMEVDYSLLKSSMTIEGKKYTGTISTDGGEVPVTGEKID